MEVDTEVQTSAEAVISELVVEPVESAVAIKEDSSQNNVVTVEDITQIVPEAECQSQQSEEGTNLITELVEMVCEFEAKKVDAEVPISEAKIAAEVGQLEIQHNQVEVQDENSLSVGAVATAISEELNRDQPSEANIGADEVENQLSEAKMEDETENQPSEAVGGEDEAEIQPSEAKIEDETENQPSEADIGADEAEIQPSEAKIQGETENQHSEVEVEQETESEEQQLQSEEPVVADISESEPDINNKTEILDAPVDMELEVEAPDDPTTEKESNCNANDDQEVPTVDKVKPEDSEAMIIDEIDDEESEITKKTETETEPGDVIENIGKAEEKENTDEQKAKSPRKTSKPKPIVPKKFRQMRRKSKRIRKRCSSGKDKDGQDSPDSQDEQDDIFAATFHKPELMHVTTEMYKGTLYRIGDIISMTGEDQHKYYAQLKHFLKNQFCERFVRVRWLLPNSSLAFSPTDETEAFKPNMFCLGPDQLEPVNMESIRFEMHIPNIYLFDRDTHFHREEQGLIHLSLPISESQNQLSTKTSTSV